MLIHSFSFSDAQLLITHSAQLLAKKLNVESHLFMDRRKIFYSFIDRPAETYSTPRHHLMHIVCVEQPDSRNHRIECFAILFF
jgi:hypothetical protein